MLRFFQAVIFLLFGLSVVQATDDVPLPADQAFAFSVDRETSGMTRLSWKIADGYYLYRDHFEAKGASDSAKIELDLPKGVVKTDPNFGSTEVYHDEVSTVLPAFQGKIRIRYQGCKENSICYPPIERVVEAQSASAISPAALVAAEPNERHFNVDDGTGGLIDGLLESGGPLFVIGSFLVFGLLLSFTPCVLPMYPILAATLAREGEHLTAKRGFALSTVYVFAMAVAFGLLGVVAAWSGQNLQIVLQSPPALIAIAVVFVVLASSMFGAFELQLPTAWIEKIGSARGQKGSVKGAAILGFTSALIVGPCVTAPLAAALLYIANTGNAPLGAAALFALGFGQGIPLIAFGTIGSSALPRAGAWMLQIKYLFGFVFLAAAVYMLNRILPSYVGLGLWAIVLISAGVFIGGFDTIAPGAPVLRRLGKAAGLILFLSGAALGAGAASGGSDPFRPLQFLSEREGKPHRDGIAFETAASSADLQKRLIDAVDAKTPTAIYFTADWCVACHHIDEAVLTAKVSRDALAGYQALKVDLTVLDDKTQSLMRELAVAGPPTMIFFDRQAQEIPGTRLVGEFDAAALSASAARGGRP